MHLNESSDVAVQRNRENSFQIADNFWLTLNRIPNDFHAQIKPTLKKELQKKIFDR